MNVPQTSGDICAVSVPAVRDQLARWAVGKPERIQRRAGVICALLDAPEHTDDVRRSLMQQVHLLRWQIDNQRS